MIRFATRRDASSTKVFRFGKSSNGSYIDTDVMLLSLDEEEVVATGLLEGLYAAAFTEEVSALLLGSGL